jgi:hypothetical protein
MPVSVALPTTDASDIAIDGAILSGGVSVSRPEPSATATDRPSRKRRRSTPST